MSKPVFEIEITTAEQNKTNVLAVFDSGAFPTIIRQDKLPPTQIIKYKSPESYRTAGQGGRLDVIGSTDLIIEYNKRMIRTQVLISPQLIRDMLIGARTMQEWDITIKNKNGETKIIIGRDMRDPDITTVV